MSDSLLKFELGKEITKKTILRFNNLEDLISKSIDL